MGQKKTSQSSKWTVEEFSKKFKSQGPTYIKTPSGYGINSNNQPELYVIRIAAQQLKIPKSSDSDDNKLNGISFKILNQLLDAQISTENKEFSLIAISSADPIDNENIVDIQAFQNKPEAIATTDKFSNSADPFYELDEDIPNTYNNENARVQRETKPNIASFVAALAQQMLSISLSTAVNTSATANGTTTTANGTTTTATSTTTTTTTY